MSFWKIYDHVEQIIRCFQCVNRSIQILQSRISYCIEIEQNKNESKFWFCHHQYRADQKTEFEVQKLEEAWQRKNENDGN